MSSDPGNLAEIGDDGCVFVPPGSVAMQGSSCIGVAGDGSAGAPFVPAPVLNPAACNGLRCTSTGLLAPQTQVVGSVGPAPGRVANNLQSVDVVVTPPAAGACPQTYTVAAYLSPLRGEAALASDVNLLPTRTSGAWANSTLQAVLPDPGVYYVAADVLGQICATVDYAGSTNLWVDARVIDVASGAMELGPRTLVQHQYSASAETRFQSCHNASATIQGLVTVTAAQGQKTVRVQGLLTGGGTGAGLTGGSTLQSSVLQGGRSYLTWFKIAD
ncbi:MAG TPA: hypothetical protein VK545_26560 [Streptomyces sp.]|nr:hypothetical protein [Streptomyces sp.]